MGCKSIKNNCGKNKELGINTIVITEMNDV